MTTTLPGLRHLLPLCGALALIQAAPAARASTLLGSTASIAVSGGGLTASATTAVVGNGVEFHTSIGIPFLDVDIGTTSVTFTAVSPVRLGVDRHITLSSLAFTGPAAIISGIVVLIGTGITGIAAGNFSFTPNSLTFDFKTATFLAGSQIIVGLTAAPTSGVVSAPVTVQVPEPASMTLLGAGLLGLGALRRRRVPA